MPEKIYDVVIVGSGPAGMFAAYELKKADPNLNVLIIEKGRLRKFRDVKDLTSGWGGAGTFTDGKLTLYFGAGGDLPDMIPPAELEELIFYVDGLYLHFLGSAAKEKIFGESPKIKRLKTRAEAARFKLLSSKVRHFGSDRTPIIVENIRQHLLSNSVEIFLETKVISVRKEEDIFHLQILREGAQKDILAKNVILAPGRDGAEWLAGQAKNLGINFSNLEPKVDIGVRLEAPYSVIEELTDALYDMKLYYKSDTYEDQVRTFCVCPGGEVELEYATETGVITVNGHSVFDPARKTKNTNFAILVSTYFTEPFKDSIAYGKRICELANMLAGTVIVQRLGDLEKGRRSTPSRIAGGHLKPTCKEAVPGDLAFIMPHRQLTDILEMIKALDKIAPGVASPHTLLYGPEVKFYTSKIDMDNNFETSVKGLYAIGDAAGISRGIMQASIMGVKTARNIVSKLKKDGSDRNEPSVRQPDDSHDGGHNHTGGEK